MDHERLILLLSFSSKAPFAPVQQDSVLLAVTQYSHLLDLGAQSSDPFSIPSHSCGDSFKYRLLHANDFLNYISDTDLPVPDSNVQLPRPTPSLNISELT